MSESDKGESEEHKGFRENIQEKLDQREIGYRQSHDEQSEDENPAIYIENPDDGNTKSGCRVSHPDIFIENNGDVDIIEVEKPEGDNSGKSPKYILGDVFSVHKSGFYRDENDEVEEFTGSCRLFIFLTSNKPDKGTKVEQYQHIRDSVDFDNGTLDDLKIFWKNQLDEMLSEIENNQKI